MVEIVISAGGLSTLILEGIKWLWRKFVVKDMSYDFPKAFYIVGVPVMNVLVVPLLVLLGMEGYSYPTSWLLFVKNIVIAAVASLITLVTYTAGVSPIKHYVAK